MIRGRAGGTVSGVLFSERYSAVRFNASDEVWTRYKDGRLSGSYTKESRSGKRGTNMQARFTDAEFREGVEEALRVFMPHEYLESSI